MNIFVIAFYLFEPIANPQAEIAAHKAFLRDKDVKSRIYISEEGINAQLSASEEAGAAYMEWLRNREPFQNVDFKIQNHHEHAFPRQTIKYRKQLVALDCKVDLSKRGQHVSPKRWKEMLESGDDHLLIDVRNSYEGKVGHFEGADLPPCDRFREFHDYMEDLKAKVDPKKTPVMMYCTGGIRCEVFSSLMKEHGFDEVYQLEGGVLKYAQEVGDAHWLGKLFVFDDRLTVPLQENSNSVIGECHHCKTSSESYYNCANMDCNELFLCCPDCVQKFDGCCQETCQEAPRRRPVSHQNPHKPFRKWYHYAKRKEELWHLRHVCDVGSSPSSADASHLPPPSSQV